MHIHNHIIWDSTNLDCNRKFRDFWGMAKVVRMLSDIWIYILGIETDKNEKDDHTRNIEK